jgi:hypothetical protein
VESEINKALRGLKSQGISVKGPIVGNDGPVYEVVGFMLTTDQIVTLQEEKKLNERGIRELSEKVKAANNKGR